MKLEFGFGNGVQAVEAPDANVVGILTPNEVHFALGFGSPTVQVVPAEALGMAYARTLPPRLPLRSA